MKKFSIFWPIYLGLINIIGSGSIAFAVMHGKFSLPRKPGEATSAVLLRSESPGLFFTITLLCCALQLLLWVYFIWLSVHYFKLKSTKVDNSRTD